MESFFTRNRKETKTLKKKKETEKGFVITRKKIFWYCVLMDLNWTYPGDLW